MFFDNEDQREAFIRQLAESREKNPAFFERIFLFKTHTLEDIATKLTRNTGFNNLVTKEDMVNAQVKYLKNAILNQMDLINKFIKTFHDSSEEHKLHKLISDVSILYSSDFSEIKNFLIHYELMAEILKADGFANIYESLDRQPVLLTKIKENLKPNMSYWLQKEYWNHVEAACLLSNLDPKFIIYQGSAFIDKFIIDVPYGFQITKDLLEVIQNWFEGTHYTTAPLYYYINMASKKNLQIPDELWNQIKKTFLDEMETNHDLGNKYSFILKKIQKENEMSKEKRFITWDNLSLFRKSIQKMNIIQDIRLPKDFSLGEIADAMAGGNDGNNEQLKLLAQIIYNTFDYLVQQLPIYDYYEKLLVLTDKKKLAEYEDSLRQIEQPYNLAILRDISLNFPSNDRLTIDALRKLVIPLPIIARSFKIQQVEKPNILEEAVLLDNDIKKFLKPSYKKLFQYENWTFEQLCLLMQDIDTTIYDEISYLNIRYLDYKDFSDFIEDMEKKIPFFEKKTPLECIELLLSKELPIPDDLLNEADRWFTKALNKEPNVSKIFPELYRRFNEKNNKEEHASKGENQQVTSNNLHNVVASISEDRKNLNSHKKDKIKSKKTHVLKEIIRKVYDSSSDKSPQKIWNLIKASMAFEYEDIQEMDPWTKNDAKIYWITHRGKHKTMGSRTFENYISELNNPD